MRGRPVLTTELEEHLKNTLLLKECVKICRADPEHTCFDVVKEEANGEVYRCLFGVFQDEYRKISDTTIEYHFSTMELLFNMSGSEARGVFGVTWSISEREDFVNAHVTELNAKIELAHEEGRAWLAA